MTETSTTMASAEAITATLETIRKDRTPVSVTSPHTKRIFTSYLIKVDRQALYIDQLMPRIGNQLLQLGQVVDIGIRYKGISYQFRSSHLAQSVDNHGFPYHQLSMPDEVHYQEKRAGYRISIKLADSPTVDISVDGQEPCQALLENISESGAYLRLQGSQTSFCVNDLILCEVHFAGIGTLKCRAVTKHSHRPDNTTTTKVGVEFWQLSVSTKKQLQKALMKMHRRNIRTSIAT